MSHPTSLRLYDAIGPGITVDDDGTLLDWIDGPASLLGEVDDVVRDSEFGVGWSREFDPAFAASPRWTAQLLGVVPPSGATAPEVRQLITDRPAFRRGTVGALVAAAVPFLTGLRTVEVYERDGGAYRVTVRTYTEETPDPAEVLAALLAAKPAGLILTHEVVGMTSFAALEGEPAESYTALEATAVQTYTALEG